MSKECPLCGNRKTGDSLFCSTCTEKLNSEYEVDIPISEQAEDNLNNKKEDVSEKDVAHSSEDNSEHISSEKKEPKTSKTESKEETKASLASSFDKKAWRKQREDKRTHSDKSYYELSKEGKSNKVLVTIIFIGVLLLIIAAGLYFYNDSVKEDNLERSQWELAQRENTIDSYLAYMDEYPQGEFADEAYSNMLKLSSQESEMFKNLTTSEDLSEFVYFLEQYPQSPYQRKVKSRFDSLMWQSSLKENTAEAYSNYISRVASQEIFGDYIGKAEKRFTMLEQATPVNKEDLQQIKTAVDGFFVGISTKSHEKLSEHLAPIIARYKNQTNLSSEQITGLLLLQASKEGAELLRLEAELTNIKYELLGSGNYIVNVPVKKIFEGDEGTISEIKGYIVHLKLSSSFKVYSYHETKPYTEAP